MLSPTSRCSKRIRTGMCVPLKTGVPPRAQSALVYDDSRLLDGGPRAELGEKSGPQVKNWGEEGGHAAVPGKDPPRTNPIPMPTAPCPLIDYRPLLVNLGCILTDHRIPSGAGCAT